MARLVRTFGLSAAVAATLFATVVGCGSDDDSQAPDATVTVGGEELELADKTVGCTENGDRLNIGIGSGESAIAVVVSTGDEPEVESVALGSLDGVALGYQQGVGDGNAEVSRDGDSYTITGEATGIDVANVAEPVRREFEIAVTCPK